jgi:hypothetical protein
MKLFANDRRILSLRWLVFDDSPSHTNIKANLLLLKSEELQNKRESNSHVDDELDGPTGKTPKPGEIRGILKSVLL